MSMGCTPAGQVIASVGEMGRDEGEGRTGALPESSSRCSCKHAAVDVVLATPVRIQRRVESVVDECCTHTHQLQRRIIPNQDAPSTPALFPVKLPLLVT